LEDRAVGEEANMRSPLTLRYALGAIFFKKAIAREFPAAIFSAPFPLVGRTALPAEPITDRFSDGRNDGSALQVADLAGKKIDLCQ
jgi:hypothetical protein